MVSTAYGGGLRLISASECFRGLFFSDFLAPFGMGWWAMLIAVFPDLPLWQVSWTARPLRKLDSAAPHGTKATVDACSASTMANNNVVAATTNNTALPSITKSEAA
eukprot:CAMPEP_0172177958 /NCGR_PEP_ID=MMETSP1050-20130122/15751_1 /TAXON_ID=233186 /ORGANISM="Cryptomonas curvata, Strain CCAP979/52" /LENGTH=105 /DNA_ID=CAMNT_0012850587 /DNA_START=192 /DNA_END=506 /DNA_ORIENTATION=-